MGPRFLKTLPAAEQVVQRRGRSVAEPGREVERLLDSLAGEEIDEVDDLVEDIAEEIRDLHILRNATAPQIREGGCSLDQLFLPQQETRAPLRVAMPTMVGCQELRGLENATCWSRTTTNVEGTSTMGWTGLTHWLAVISSEATWLSR